MKSTESSGTGIGLSEETIEMICQFQDECSLGGKGYEIAVVARRDGDIVTGKIGERLIFPRIIPRETV